MHFYFEYRWCATFPMLEKLGQKRYMGEVPDEIVRDFLDEIVHQAHGANFYMDRKDAWSFVVRSREGWLYV